MYIVVKIVGRLPCVAFTFYDDPTDPIRRSGICLKKFKILKLADLERRSIVEVRLLDVVVCVRCMGELQL